MKLTKQQKVSRAIDRMEDAALDLIRYVENYAQNSNSLCYKRKGLFEAARLYAAKVDAVSRARVRKVHARSRASDSDSSSA